MFFVFPLVCLWRLASILFGCIWALFVINKLLFTDQKKKIVSESIAEGKQYDSTNLDSCIHRDGKLIFKRYTNIVPDDCSNPGLGTHQCGIIFD